MCTRMLISIYVYVCVYTGGQKLMKYVLIALNVIFLIFGIVLIAVGSYAQSMDVNALSGISLAKVYIRNNIAHIYVDICTLIHAASYVVYYIM